MNEGCKFEMLFPGSVLLNLFVASQEVIANAFYFACDLFKLLTDSLTASEAL